MMITTSNSLYRILSTTLPLFVIFLASNSEGVWAESSEQPGIDFNREIRPILSDHCFACHGPDEHDRKADLRLDTIEGLRSILSEQDTDRDFILDRIHSEDSDVLMPPPEFPFRFGRRIRLNSVESHASMHSHCRLRNAPM